jgi:hypothetical protein
MNESEQLETLKQENETLRKQLNDLIKSSEDLAAYKVFIKANEMFSKWVLVLVAASTVFGYLSFSNVLNNIRDEANKQVKESILPKIEVEVLKEANDRIKVVVDEFEKQLEAQKKQNLIAKSDLELEIDSVQPKTQLVQEKRYYVVGGSGNNYQRLKNEYKNKLVSKYDIRVCPPKGVNKFSAVVLSLKDKQDLVPLVEAKALVNMAKNDFRPDTYAIRESSAFFDSSKCELL